VLLGGSKVPCQVDVGGVTDGGRLMPTPCGGKAEEIEFLTTTERNGKFVVLNKEINLKRQTTKGRKRFGNWNEPREKKPWGGGGKREMVFPAWTRTFLLTLHRSSGETNMNEGGGIADRLSSKDNGRGQGER